MRARIGIAVAAIALCAGGAEAQKPGRFGIGVSISPTIIVADEPLPPLTSFSFPMNFAGTFRLEPELGFGNANIKESDPFSGDFEASYSTLTIGVGAYFLFSGGDGFLLYAGPRLGMQRQSETFKFTGQPDDKMTRTDTFFGFGLGGEHFFSSHLSLGAEARLTHVSLGKPKIEPSGGPEPDFKASGNATDGVVFVRFYF